MSHHCSMTLPQPRGFQRAIEECTEDEKTGEFTVGNGEYGNEVRFCPECGVISPAEKRRRDSEAAVIHAAAVDIATKLL